MLLVPVKSTPVSTRLTPGPIRWKSWIGERSRIWKRYGTPFFSLVTFFPASVSLIVKPGPTLPCTIFGADAAGAVAASASARPAAAPASAVRTVRVIVVLLLSKLISRLGGHRRAPVIPTRSSAPLRGRVLRDELDRVGPAVGLAVPVLEGHRRPRLRVGNAGLQRARARGQPRRPGSSARGRVVRDARGDHVVLLHAHLDHSSGLVGIPNRRARHLPSNTARDDFG